MLSSRKIASALIFAVILCGGFTQCVLIDADCGSLDPSCESSAAIAVLSTFFPSTAAAPTALPVAGSQLWLLAGYGRTQDAGVVTAWADQSGNQFNAVAPGGSGPTLKTDALNGEPVLNFDGVLSNFTLLSNYIFSPAANGGLTIFAVARSDHTDGTNLHNLIDFGFFANAGYGLRYSSNSGGASEASFYTPTDGSGGTLNFDVTATTSEYVILTARAEFLVEMRAYINGTSVNSVVTGLTDLSSTIIRAQPARAASAGGPVSIGFQSKDPDPTRAFKGDLAEIIVFSSALSDADRRLIECYLNGKYSISVGHTCS